MNITFIKKVLLGSGIISNCPADFSLESKPGAYCILNTKTRKVYIGASSNCKARVLGHIRALKSNRHIIKAMQADYNECPACFIFFVIDYVQYLKAALFLEAYWLIAFGRFMVYNMQNAGCFVHNHTCKLSNEDIEVLEVSKKIGAKSTGVCDRPNGQILRVYFRVNKNSEVYIPQAHGTTLRGFPPIKWEWHKRTYCNQRKKKGIL